MHAPISRLGYEPPVHSFLLFHQAQVSPLHTLIPLSMTSTYLDYSRGMSSKVGQPLQLAHGCDRPGKGLEHGGCSAEGEETALIAFKTCCLCQRLQSLLWGGPLVKYKVAMGLCLSLLATNQLYPCHPLSEAGICS